MADDKHFISIRIRNTSFLLPANASLGIEQRETLEINSGKGSRAVAWKIVGANKWPAYALDENLKLTGGNAWERVVYLQDGARVVGLAAENIQIMNRDDIQVQPFLPVGPAPKSGKHLFSSSWIEGNTPVLMFEPSALAAYLTVVGGVS
ncbi:MAG: hypothetical protein ACC635_03025 [Acidiferrobacterales bacterium]